MAHKGLNPDAVVKAAAELIEKQGREAFSMRLLAEDLGIKTASLYNHVDNMETLLAEVCRYGLCLQKEVEMQAMEGAHGEDAVRRLADTYRRFAKEHRELYGLIMSMSAKNQQVRDDAAVLFTDPLKKMLEEFHLKEEENIHFRRLFRAIVHGFVSQEEQGFFSHYPASVEDSFHFAVQCYIDSLKQGKRGALNMGKGKNNEELFRSMPVTQAILTLAVPTVVSQIITIIYNMADTFFIGQLGDPKQVAAATLAMPLFMFMTALSNLFGVGGASLISRFLGAGEREKASRCGAFCIWTAAAVSVLYGLMVLAGRPVLLPVLGANEETCDMASSYVFWTIGLGALPTVMNPALAHLIRSEGYSRQASFGVAFGGILNMVLDPLFIYGLHLQITGAAVATLISNTTAMFYFLAFIWKIRGVSVLTLSPGMYTLGEHIPAEVISVGLPSFLISMMGTVSNTVLNHIIAGYSSVAVAGMGIAKKLNMLAFAVGQGITQGTLPLIGYNYTSGNKKRMLDAIRALFVFSLGVALAIAVLLYTQAAAVSRLFIDNSETVAYGCRFLRIICSASPMTAMTFFALTVFQATGKKRQPIILSMLRKGTVDVPFMILFNHVFGIRGVAWATPVAEVTSLMVAAAMVIPYIRKLAREPERKGPVSETKTCKLVGK